MKRQLLLLALTCLTGCLDADTESGVYGSPCASAFGRLLLCGREGGGADPGATTPGGTTGDTTYTCQDACETFAQCGLLAQENIAACAQECSTDATPTQLDCLRTAGCNLNAIEACFQ